MEEPKLYAALPGICEEVGLASVRFFASALLDYANGTIVLEDVFRLRRTGWIGLLGTLFLKRTLIMHIGMFTMHSPPWNMVSEAFKGSERSTSPVLLSPAIISSQGLQVAVSCAIWASIAVGESICWTEGQTLARWLRAPLLLLFRKPPRLLWFFYVSVARIAFQTFTAPLATGALKGTVLILPLLRPISDRIASFLLARGPRRHQRHARAALAKHDDDAQLYPYNPLGDHQIRLLRLAADLPAELITVHIDQAPIYVAVSYRWRPGAKDFSLTLQHGHSIPIPSSVHKILQSLTPPNGSMHLWIDSICIDQASRAEKEAQIPLMGNIYRRAARVVACIPNIAHSQFLASDMQQMIAVFAASGDRVLLQKGVRVLSKKDRWNAIKTLMQDDFWERLWIIQEVVLPKQLVVLAGDCLMEWSLVTEFAQHQATATTRQWGYGDGNEFEMTALFGTITATRHIRMLDQLRRKAEQLGSVGDDTLGLFHLWDILPLTALSQATIANDKLYGILGLCREVYGVGVRANYDMPAHQIFKGASRLAIARGSLKLLHHAGLALRESSETSLYPSWAFDLDYAKAQSQGTLSFFADLDKFAVARSIKPVYEPVKAGEDDATLRLRGRVIDKIIACDSGRTLREAGVQGHFSQGFERFEIDLTDEEEAVVAAIPDLEKCLKQYRSSLHQIKLTLLAMLRIAPDGYMAKVPDIVLEHIPETYMGMPRGEAYWRTVLTKQPSEDMTSQLGMVAHAYKVGDWQRRIRMIYAQLATIEEKALFFKAFAFNLALTPADSEAIAASPVISQFMVDAKDMLDKQSPAGAHEFLSAYWASQAAHLVVVTEKGYLALAPRGTRVGDIIVVFNGAHVPSIVRKGEDGEEGFVLWTGASYVCGLMEEDALQGIGEERWFELR